MPVNPILELVGPSDESGDLTSQYKVLPIFSTRWWSGNSLVCN